MHNLFKLKSSIRMALYLSAPCSISNLLVSKRSADFMLYLTKTRSCSRSTIIQLLLFVWNCKSAIDLRNLQYKINCKYSYRSKTMHCSSCRHFVNYIKSCYDLWGNSNQQPLPLDLFENLRQQVGWSPSLNEEKEEGCKEEENRNNYVRMWDAILANLKSLDSLVWVI